MNTVARLLVVGAVAIAVGGCASTGPEPLQTPPPRTPGLGSTAEAIPWSGEDLLFLQRAVVGLEGRLQSPSVSAPSDVEISVGPSTTLTELMVAASFTEWEAGQTLLVESGIVDARAAARLERALIRVRGASIAGSLDVASRRLPAALGLHWSGWERLGRGLWREPVSQVSVHIPHRGDWRVQRGPAITAPVEETLTGGATRLLVAAGAPQGVPVPLLIWGRGLSVAGLPEQVVPSRLTIAVTPQQMSDDLLVHVALPFASERDARVGVVASRLVLPRFLHEIGLERGERFNILRNGSELYLVNVILTLEQLTDVLIEGVEE